MNSDNVLLHNDNDNALDMDQNSTLDNRHIDHTLNESPLGSSESEYSYGSRPESTSSLEYLNIPEDGVLPEWPPMSPDLVFRFRNYQCKMCKKEMSDEKSENTQKVKRRPYALKHLALAKAYQNILESPLENRNRILDGEYFTALFHVSTNLIEQDLRLYITGVTRYANWSITVKDIALAMYYRRGERMRQSLMERREDTPRERYKQHILFEKEMLGQYLRLHKFKIVPDCCCVRQRRELYSECCGYSMKYDRIAHTENVSIHCCDGYYKYSCRYFSECIDFKGEQ